MKTEEVLPGLRLPAASYPRAGGTALTAKGPETFVTTCDRAKKVQNKAVVNTCTLVRASRAENKLLLGSGDAGAAGKSSQEAMLSRLELADTQGPACGE